MQCLLRVTVVRSHASGVQPPRLAWLPAMCGNVCSCLRRSFWSC